jgi:hypothetical protein
MTVVTSLAHEFERIGACIVDAHAVSRRMSRQVFWIVGVPSLGWHMALRPAAPHTDDRQFCHEQRLKRWGFL